MICNALILAPFGRRGWKMVYARLRGMVLYLHKDENGFRRGRYQTFTSAILLHHSFAEKAVDYPKRPHVFRLRTANLGEFLFETWLVASSFLVLSLLFS